MEATALFDIFTSYRIFMPFTYQVAYGFMPQRLCPMAKVATQPTLPKALKLAESLSSARAIRVAFKLFHLHHKNL